MGGFTCSAATLFVAMMTVTAFAGSDIPDLRGTWVMKMHAVVHEKQKEMQPERHIDVRKGFAEVDFVLTIVNHD